MNPRQLGQYADEAGDAVRQTIRAYHGSPHDFDRFDASKIGTGEGGQAYGHGLYFAGNEDVARSYRDSLKDMVDLPVPDELDGQLRQVISEIGQLSGQRGKFVGVEWDAIQKQLDQKQNLLIELQHQYRSAAQNPGHMYEVQIGYPEESLLDYNRPFSTPAGVAAAEVLRQDNPAAVSESALRAIQDGTWRMESFAGRSPYETAAVELTRLAKTQGGAQALTEAGIPGIRYLDQGSRSSGEGTRNYVVFPGAEDQIRILRKYALPGAVGTGVASQYEEER